MRRLLVVALLLCVAVPAFAANVGVIADEKPAGVIYSGGGRVGGDTIGDATVIPSIPYYDGGNTCGYVNDYDEICPYSGSTSPDVVYAFAPGASIAVAIDLCDSQYDTKVYVYQNAVGNLIACNDDASCGYSGWQSHIDEVVMTPGNTYYIVVDGYGGACGDYSLAVTEVVPCEVPCPAGAQIEGEPPCVDNYYDSYNGGCNSTGYTTVLAQDAGCATVCGKSCTYLYQGSSYRDTDWYTMNALGGNVTVLGQAEFPFLMFIIYGPSGQNVTCSNYTLLSGTGNPCVDVNISYSLVAGVEFWVWAGPSVFTGITEKNYVFTVCGIEGGVVPTEETTWGAIKNSYK